MTFGLFLQTQEYFGWRMLQWASELVGHKNQRGHDSPPVLEPHRARLLHHVDRQQDGDGADDQHGGWVGQVVGHQEDVSPLVSD